MMAEEMKQRIRVDGFVSEASLSTGGELRWRRHCDSGDRERSLAVESDVLGLSVEGRNLSVRAFVKDVKGFSTAGFGKRLMKDFLLEMPTDEIADLWADRLRAYINSLGRPRRLFIIVNPYSGRKCARKIFQSEIKPILVAANIMYTLQETQYQLHAQEIAYKLDLLKYDGIVCVSGDGVLVEVFNGLLKREDWNTAIRVPLGIIPAGTGNGLAKSLVDAVGEMNSIQNATFAIVRGHKRSLDVTTILQGETKFFSILMLTWGLIADIDIESEKYRWMGSTRIDFYSFLRIINLRKYHGRVEFVPAPGLELYGEQINDRGRCLGSTNTLNAQRQNSAEVFLQGGYQGPTGCFDHSDWRFLEGPFISVSLFNVPWVGEDAKPAPEAEFSDGFLDLAILKDCSKAALISLLLQMSDGSHVKSPYVIYLKVKAFRLVPGNRVENPTIGGIIDVDGEVIARGEGTYKHGKQADLMTYGPPIQLIVDKGLATIFTPK